MYCRRRQDVYDVQDGLCADEATGAPEAAGRAAQSPRADSASDDCVGIGHLS